MQENIYKIQNKLNNLSNKRYYINSFIFFELIELTAFFIAKDTFLFISYYICDVFIENNYMLCYMYVDIPYNI